MDYKKVLTTLQLLMFLSTISCFNYIPSGMKCSYGDRGSLTATCINATSSYFRLTTYRFDHLDETVRCINCNLQTVSPNAFDISGNEIITLDLCNSNITALSQSSFVGLVYMKNLLLSGNRIKTVIPGTFKGIKKVVNLNLANNNLSMLSRDSFSELANLTTLNLQNNLIRHIDSSAFSGLSSLKKLYLQNNFIKDLKEVFLGLNSIELINMENNELEQIRPLEINMTTLVELNFAKNRLEALIPDIFLQLPNLNLLDISSNQIPHLNNAVFRGLRSLEVLDLSNNTIENLEPAVFLRLYNLREIDLGYNKLKTLSTIAFTALPELRTLNVSHNLIGEIKRTGVQSLHNLHTLDLSYNKLTYLDYKLLLLHAPKLVYINIEQNNWPCYLIQEMETYFKEDNVQFTLDDKYLNFTIKCNASIERPEEVASEIAKLEADLMAPPPPEQSFTSLYILYTLVFLTMLLVGVLFYLQCRSSSHLIRPFRGADLSDVRLITSSGLENREGEY